MKIDICQFKIDLENISIKSAFNADFAL